MRKLVIYATAVAGLLLLNAAPALAACTFPTLNLGSFISGDRSANNFAVMPGGTMLVGGANHYHVTISGCAATKRYRLKIGAPILLNNAGKSLDLVPFVVSVNGTPLAVPADLTRENNLVLTGNPDLEIVLARTTETLALSPGSYGGGYVMQFEDQ